MWYRKCYSLMDLVLYFSTYWYFKNIRGGSKIMFCFLVYHTSNVSIEWDYSDHLWSSNWMLVLLSSKIVTFGSVVISKKAITFSSSLISIFLCCVILRSVAHIWTSPYFFRGCLKVRRKVRHFSGAFEQCQFFSQAV